MKWNEIYVLLDIVHRTAGQDQFRSLHNAAVEALKEHQDQLGAEQEEDEG